MAITGIGGNYNGSVYESAYAAQKSVAVKKAEASKMNETSEVKAEAVKNSNEEYLKQLQKQTPYITLQIGYGLNTKKDNKVGVVTINPRLLEEMQNNPESEKKYTQTIKDIERAEKTVNAYYDALGGCVEHTSHWYIDENGKYYHFGYVYRDDKLNKRLREEAQKNAEERIEKTRENARERAEQLAERLEENAKTKEAAVTQKGANTGSTADYLRTLEKLAPSVEFRIGNTFSSAKTGKTLTINPKLLEKMQNDPEQEKETMELIRGVEAMTKLSESMNKASGWKTVFRHSYIDENGKYCHIALVRNEHGYKLSEKLRKERWENAEKLIEKTKEKAARKREELQEKLDEKRAETADEKSASDTDMKEIIEAIKEDNSDKTDTKELPQVGAKLDMKI